MVKVRFPVPFPEVFVARTKTTVLFAVAAVGVPVIAPVVAFKVSPAGRVPLATA